MFYKYKRRNYIIFNFVPLGDCTLIIGDITLPSCGHRYPNAKCYESRNVNSVLCRVKVFKTLPKCGHKLEVMVI